ncbi:unknown [Bacteroides sp. CAG:875]|nr:unknown [Bacteroides sp. CAG:875]
MNQHASLNFVHLSDKRVSFYDEKQCIRNLIPDFIY